MMDLTFRTDGQALIRLGSTNKTLVFYGTWNLRFKALGVIPKVELAGFGHADHLKFDSLLMHGFLDTATTRSEVYGRLVRSEISIEQVGSVGPTANIARPARL